MAPQDQPLPSWSVSAIVREPPEVLYRFVAWHLDAGASAIALYFDDPDDAAIPLLAHLPQVTARRCTPAFWAKAGVAPDAAFVKRQNAAMQLGYRAATTDWFLNIDADELIWVDARPVAALLAGLPKAARTLLVEPVEHIDIAGASGRLAFRRRLSRRHLARYLSDEDRRALQRRGGMAGHRIGKSFIRTGIEAFTLRQHFPQIGDAAVTDAEAGPDQGCALLHFLSHDYAIWRAKLPERITRKAFINRLRPRLEGALQTGDEAAIRQVFRLLFELDAATADWLKRRGKVIEPAIGLDAAVARYFPAA